LGIFRRQGEREDKNKMGEIKKKKKKGFGRRELRKDKKKKEQAIIVPETRPE
jgi:hypothetical protein